MKRQLVLLSLLFLAACNNSKEPGKGDNSVALVNNPHTAGGLDTVVAARKPTLDFTDTVHEFGNITEGEIVTHDFSFINNGKTPLLIADAVGSCGCTVPDFPRDPIQPGKGGTMKVTFRSSGKHGHQEKSVTIHDNTLRGVHYLYIKGEVNESKNK